jgi:hypothetical protein
MTAVAAVPRPPGALLRALALCMLLGACLGQETGPPVTRDPNMYIPRIIHQVSRSGRRGRGGLAVAQ